MLNDATAWLDHNAPLAMELFGSKVVRCDAAAPYARVRKLIRKRLAALDRLHDRAVKTDDGALREIQAALATDLPPAVSAPMRVLVVMAVGKADQLANLKTWLRTLGDYDFFVYSYACATPAELAPHRKALKGFKNLARLHHKVGTGCKLDFWKHTLETMRNAKLKQYTHVWFVDNDLDLRHFDQAAFEALVKHNAPLVCQPGILARARGERSSDHPLCEAQFRDGAARARNFGSFGYDFRGRRLRDAYGVKSVDFAGALTGIEVMCPLLDGRILDAFYAVVRHFDARSDWACERVFNQLATEFAARATARGIPRVNKLVLDFVPLIHMDTRTIGKTSACVRGDLDEVKIKKVCAAIDDDVHPLRWVKK